MNLLALALATLVSAAPPHDEGHKHGHPGVPSGAAAGEGAHGNPSDLDGYIARMESPQRAAWQKPDEVVNALALKPGAVVCEIGAGPGYFSLRLGKAVGAAGTVYAVDVEPRMLAVLRDRLEKSGARNVVPVLGMADDPLLPAALCDVVFLVNTLHHFAKPQATLERLTRSLKRDGRIVNVDFKKAKTPVGPPVESRIDRADYLAMAKRAGLKVVAEHGMLPYQYFIELKANPAAGSSP